MKKILLIEADIDSADDLDRIAQLFIDAVTSTEDVLIVEKSIRISEIDQDSFQISEIQ